MKSTSNLDNLERFLNRSALLKDVIRYTEALSATFKDDLKIINSKIDDLNDNYGKDKIFDNIKNLDYRISMLENTVFKIIDYLASCGYNIR